MIRSTRSASRDASDDLRIRILARTFYRELRQHQFTEADVLEIACELVRLASEDEELPARAPANGEGKPGAR